MWRRAIGLLTCALPLWASLAAQYGPLERVVYPDDLRDDLAIMRQTLEQAHPDPYRYRVKTELDMLFDAIAASMDTPMTAEGFIRAGLPVLKAIGDAGTNLEPPLGVQDLYAHTVPLIPITVRVIGGRLYLDEELKGFRSLPTAC